ncbi:MAG: hypothetical protein ABFD08_18045, partial [Syntrophomonas sp.]
MKKVLASCLATAVLMMTFAGCAQTGAVNTAKTAITSNVQAGSSIANETGSVTTTDYSSAQVISLSEG